MPARASARLIGRAPYRGGAEVALLVRETSKLLRVVDDLGDGAIAVEADGTDAASLDRAAAAVERELRRVDILVNNVDGLLRPFGAVPDADWPGTLGLNVLSVVRLVRRIVPARGCASVHDLRGEPTAAK